jgi:hypothetical protein
LKEIARNLALRLNSYQFFRDNPPSVNTFLFLFAISYFVVGADLCKEMAKEKDEIGFFTGIIENSVHSDSSSVYRLLETIPQVEIKLPAIVFTIHSSDFELFPPARSPPFA